ncbi:MAG TPA: outer membrane beta-barrel protein, partial [Chitinophagales bacterium]
MKNNIAFIVLAVLLFMSNNKAFAQTEQQAVMLGGTTGISYVSQKPTHTFSMSFNPNFGYFIVKNLMLGFGMNIGISSDNTSKDHKNRVIVSSSFVPQIRYYFLKEKLRPFVYARFGYQSSTSIHNGNISNTDGMTGEGGVGLDYFLTKNVAL